MPQMQMIGINEGPSSIAFTLKCNGKNVHHVAGTTFFVETESVDEYLAYSHPCDSGEKKLFSLIDIPRSETAVEMLLQQLDNADIKGLDLTAIREQLPHLSPTGPAVDVVRCKSCDQKVRITIGATNCPHCEGLIAGEAEGVITATMLQDDDEGHEKGCPHCDFVPRSLQMTKKRA